MSFSPKASASSMWAAVFVAAFLASASNAFQNACGGVPFELLSCFYAVGGGETPGSRIPQPQIETPACAALYMEYVAEGGQYWKDVQTAADAANSLMYTMVDSSKMVTLDIDETSLSNLAFYIAYKFKVTSEDRHEWYLKGEATAIEPVLTVYKRLRMLGYSVVFITGRGEALREATERNLREVGYGEKCETYPPEFGKACYYDLIMKQPGDKRRATEYKSAEREQLTEAGFDIVAGIADQWSDILGPFSTLSLIKLPNPFYYIP